MAAALSVNRSREGGVSQGLPRTERGVSPGSAIQVRLCFWSILKSANLLRLFPSSADLLALLVQHYQKSL